MTIKITSENRNDARKLLTFCGNDSRVVRTMTLADLGFALQRAINEGLVTQQQVDRMLNKEKDDWKNDDAHNHNDGKHRDSGQSEDNDYDDQNSDESSGNSAQESESSEHESDNDDGQSDGNSDGESNQSSESESESDASNSDNDSESNDGENSDGESDGDSDNESNGESDNGKDGDESDNESDSESDSDGNGESESQSNDESKDDESNDDDDSDLRHEMFPVVLKYIRSGLNVALVGPAGSGKSYITRDVAAELDRDYYVHGAMMSKYDLIGYCDAHGTYHDTPAYNAFVHGGVHTFDELDASAPDSVVAFNGMTDDQPFYTFPNGMQEQHPDYVAVACMNTYGNGASADYVGRYKQDAASMSRFVKVFIDYDRKIEARIAGTHKDILHRVWALRDSCNELGIRHIVSTRMIVQATKARELGKATKAELDRDVFFAGLDDSAIKQLKPRVTTKQKEYDNAS